MGSVAETWPRHTSHAASGLHVCAEGIRHSTAATAWQMPVSDDGVSGRTGDSQLGWFPLRTVPVQLLLTICLIMISEETQLFSGRQCSRLVDPRHLGMWTCKAGLGIHTYFRMNESFISAATTQANSKVHNDKITRVTFICSFLRATGGRNMPWLFQRWQQIKLKVN